MSVGKKFLKIDFSQGHISIESYQQPKLLLDSLSQESNDEFEYVIDHHLKIPEIIKRVIRKSSDDNINCYIVKKSATQFDVLVKDFKGHIFYQRYQRTSDKYLVSYYHQFIDNLRLGSGFLSTPIINPVFHLADISATENKIEKNVRFKTLKDAALKLPKVYWSVSAVATLNSDNRVCFDLYIGEQGYCYRDFGELVYRNLAQAILKTRQIDSNHYPIFITNLDLSAVYQEPQLPHYFEFKRLIEQKLEKAVGQLKNKK